MECFFQSLDLFLLYKVELHQIQNVKPQNVVRIRKDFNYNGLRFKDFMISKIRLKELDEWYELEDF